MGKSDIFKLADQFQNENRAYVLAQIIRNEKPSSGSQGDKAIILENGKFYGWIGGGCIKPTVMNEAKLAFKEGTPRLIRISPDLDDHNIHGIKNYKMTCHSGGSVDVYIEPVLSQRKLIILGKSSIAQSLARIGSESNYNVSIFAKGDITGLFDSGNFEINSDYNLKNAKITNRANLVVSTQGEQDELALEQALQSKAGYIGFVVSRKKWDQLRVLMKNKGYSDDQLSRIKAPAGLDIEAKTPEEVAISILAQIIQYQRNREKKKQDDKVEEKNVLFKFETETDPICNMQVSVEDAEYITEYEGKKYYFCCLHCRDTFLENPKIFA